MRHFRMGHPASAGHFPGNPIIPGAVLLREVAAAVGESTAAMCRGVRSAKFHRPVRPGDTLVIDWSESAGGEVRFSGVVEGTVQAAVSGVLRLVPP